MIKTLILNALNRYHNKQKTLLDGKAPNNHASTATTYGEATMSNYGPDCPAGGLGIKKQLPTFGG